MRDIKSAIWYNPSKNNLGDTRPIQFKFVGDNMNAIGNKIRYLSATNDPLSADVYLIDGDKYCYVYDVGNDDRSLQYINQLSKEKVIILSHHHKDHTGNIESVQVGRN